MKLYYIAPKAEYLGNLHLFKESHYLDLPNGEVCVAIAFGDDGAELSWRNQPGVDPFPHPFEAQTIGAGRAAKLNARRDGLGRNKAQEPDFLPTDTIHDVAKKLGAIMPTMRQMVY